MVYAIAHDGLFKNAVVTTHPHAEAAKQYLAAQKSVAGNVVIGEEDLAISGPALVALYNFLTPDGPAVKKFSTKKDAQRRVFAALELKFGKQPEEPFNPVEEPTGSKDNNSGADNKEDSSEGSNSNEEANMATKKKTAKKKTAKKIKTPRVAAPLFVELNGNKPAADMKCGTYIRSMIMAGKTTPVILEQVAKHYPDSSAKASDVSWNKGKLKAAGKKIPAAE